MEDFKVLEDKVFDCHNLLLHDFFNRNCNADSQIMDLILSEPPLAPSRSYIHGAKRKSVCCDEIDRYEATKFPKFCKRVLYSGGMGYLLHHSIFSKNGKNHFLRQDLTSYATPLLF